MTTPNTHLSRSPLWPNATYCRPRPSHAAPPHWGKTADVAEVTCARCKAIRLAELKREERRVAAWQQEQEDNARRAMRAEQTRTSAERAEEEG